jgi:hypothetical protein
MKIKTGMGIRNLTVLVRYESYFISTGNYIHEYNGFGGMEP